MKLAPALLLLLSLPAIAGLYRWVDAQGKVHYTDQPAPPTAKQVSEKKFSTGTLTLAQPKVSVTLFATATCGEPCELAKTFLAKRSVSYTSKDPDIDVAANEALRADGGSARVPTLMVDGDKIEGFNESAWNYALNKAGFSKPAPEKSGVTPPDTENPGAPYPR